MVGESGGRPRELRPNHEPRALLDEYRPYYPRVRFRANCRALHRVGVGNDVKVGLGGFAAQAVSIDGGRTPDTDAYDFSVPWSAIARVEKPALLFDPAIRVHLVDTDLYCEFYFSERGAADRAAVALARFAPQAVVVQPDPLWMKIALPLAGLLAVGAAAALIEWLDFGLLKLGWPGELLYIAGLREVWPLWALFAVGPVLTILVRWWRHAWPARGAEGS